MEKNRLEAFSDGVFAIVITLLVLEIKVPHVSADMLSIALWKLMPKFLSFGLSFVIIGVYWVAHHNMLHFIQKVDRHSLWLNISVLFAICIIPFPTALMGDYPFEPTTVVFYGITLAFTNLMGTIFWYYNLKHPNLLIGNINPVFAKRVTIIHASPMVIYIIAMLLSFVSIWVSYIIYLAVPVFFVLPNPLLKKLFKDAYL